MLSTRSLKTEDRIKLILGMSFMLGIIVRFAPGIATGFPLNDGGMFYSMILDLRDSNYLLPKTTSYNFLDIPYAYPPFGFYLARTLSDVLHISEISLLRWLPPIVSSISILAFYFLTSELLDSKLHGAIAASIYALTPGSFSWFIMGGGLTRALGSLFLILATWSMYRLFKSPNKHLLFYTILFCTLAIVSHPEAGIHTAATCFLLWIFFGRSLQKTFYALTVIAGTVLFSMPWWLVVITNHGLRPFISALHTGMYGTSVFEAVFLNIFSYQGLVPVLVILRLAGMIWILWKRYFFLLLWVILPFLVEPRSAPSVAFYPLSIIATLGLTEALPALIRRINMLPNPANAQKRIKKIYWTDIFFYIILFYLFVESYLYGFRQVNTSLTTADRTIMSWVNEHTPANSSFLLVTGTAGPETDAFQEWFPVLADRHSLTTLQGLEWLLGPQFFDYYRELRALQACESVTCIKTWSIQNEVGVDYLLVLKSKLHQKLAFDLENDVTYMKIFETNTAQIFKHLR